MVWLKQNKNTLFFFLAPSHDPKNWSYSTWWTFPDFVKSRLCELPKTFCLIFYDYYDHTHTEYFWLENSPWLGKKDYVYKYTAKLVARRHIFLFKSGLCRKNQTHSLISGTMSILCSTSSLSDC